MIRKQDILYQTDLQKIRINTRLFYDFFIHFSCTEICIRLIRLIRLITGTPPPLDGRGAVPYPCRYIQKNQTTKKHQFLFLLVYLIKLKKHLNSVNGKKHQYKNLKPTEKEKIILFFFGGEISSLLVDK